MAALRPRVPRDDGARRRPGARGAPEEPCVVARLSGRPGARDLAGTDDDEITGAADEIEGLQALSQTSLTAAPDIDQERTRRAYRARLRRDRRGRTLAVGRPRGDP